MLLLDSVSAIATDTKSRCKCDNRYEPTDGALVCWGRGARDARLWLVVFFSHGWGGGRSREGARQRTQMGFLKLCQQQVSGGEVRC
jgi:hypothetical protein